MRPDGHETIWRFSRPPDLNQSSVCIYPGSLVQVALVYAFERRLSRRGMHSVTKFTRYTIRGNYPLGYVQSRVQGRVQTLSLPRNLQWNVTWRIGRSARIRSVRFTARAPKAVDVKRR